MTQGISSPALPAQLLHPVRVGLGALGLFLAVLVAWAIHAPLATSLQASGHLIARHPSLDLQHPYGGQLRDILIAPHQRVSAGQALAHLDVTAPEAEHRSLSQLIANLTQRQQVLERLSTLPPQAAWPKDDLPPSAFTRQLAGRHDSLHQERQATQHHSDSTQRRAQGMARGLDSRRQQAQLMQLRLTRHQKLADQGALPQGTVALLQEDLLALQARIHEDETTLQATLDQARQQQQAQVLQDLAFRQSLLDQLADLHRQLPELQARQLQLADQIAQATIRAPVNGTVAALEFDTAEMFLPRGATFVTLARDRPNLRIGFVASPQIIDQLKVGMSGFVSFNSLPQRGLPRVGLRILSLAPEARRGSDGAVLGFDGQAEIDPTDFAKLKQAMGDHLSLSPDMPVHLMFSGRTTTLADYLIGPFLSFWNKALED